MKKKLKQLLIGSLGVMLSMTAFTQLAQTKASAETTSKYVNYTSSYFTLGENSTIVEDFALPKYISERKNGIKITSTQADEKVIYNNLIDVTNITKDDLLCELAITPAVGGKLEFNKLIVRLEDAENPKIYVDVNLSTNRYDDASIRQYVETTVKPNTISSAKGAFYGGFVDTDNIQDTNQDGKITYEDITTPENGLGTLIGSHDSNAITAYEEGRLNTKNLWDRLLNSDGTYNKVKSYKSLTGVSGYYRAIAANFAGSGIVGYSNTVKLYYDNEEKAIYTGNHAAWPLGCLENSIYDFESTSSTKVKLLDMDDMVEMGNNSRSVWTGFPSGKVKMSFQATSFEGEKPANYTILTIDNQTMAGVVLKDTTAPKLYVDDQGYGKYAMPDAIIGKAYPLYQATAIDAIDGILPVEIVVNGNVLPQGQNYWISTDYLNSVVYRATDRSGNTVEKSFTFCATTSLPELKGVLQVQEGAFDFANEALKDENGYFPVTTFCPIRLPKMTAQGGSGTPIADVAVYYNGQAVDVNNNEFSPQKEGLYTVYYTVKDYIGQTIKYQYNLIASYQEKILLTKPILPKYAVQGQAVFFANPQAVYYTAWGQKVEAYSEIRVYKEDGETLLQTFEKGMSAKYTANGTEGEYIVVEYIASKTQANLSDGTSYKGAVALIQMNQMSDLLVEEGEIEKDVTMMETNVYFQEDGASVEFAHPLSIMGDGVSIRFTSSEEMKFFDYFTISVYDINDYTRSISVAFSTGTDVRLDSSGKEYTVGFVAINPDASFKWIATKDFVFGNKQLYSTLKIKADGSVYIADTFIGKADEFTGFISGRVYVKISGYGIASGKTAGIILSQFNGDIIANSNMDFKLPIISVSEKLQSDADLGTYLNIPSAMATDVFNGTASLKVSVLWGDEQIYQYFDEYGVFAGDAIFLSTYGEYTVVYEALDATNRTFSTQFKIRVRDRIAPVIMVDGEIATEATAKENLQLPKATAKDNVDSDLTVYVVIIDPMNVYTVITQDEDYTFNMKGRYLVKFYCEDDCYNSSYSKEYQIIVK